LYITALKSEVRKSTRVRCASPRRSRGHANTRVGSGLVRYFSDRKTEKKESGRTEKLTFRTWGLKKLLPVLVSSCKMITSYSVSRWPHIALLHWEKFFSSYWLKTVIKWRQLGKILQFDHWLYSCWPLILVILIKPLIKMTEIQLSNWSNFFNWPHLTTV